MSEHYVARLHQQATAAAELADRIATRIVAEWQQLPADTRRSALDGMHAAAHERDVLRAQIAWHQRRTAWCWPSQPAWTD